MDVTAEEQLPSGWLVLTVSGEVDLHTAARLREALSDALAALQDREQAAAATGAGGVVVDLAGVEFMDSAGLGVLVAGMKQALMAALGYRLAGVDARMGKLLQITGLLKVLPIYDDVAAALSA